MIRKLAKKTKPLCYLPCGNLVCYSYGKLIVFSENTIISEHNLFSNFKERHFWHSKLLIRLLRLGVRQAIAMDDDHIILSVKNEIYEYCFSTKQLSKGFVMNDRIRPLIFSVIKDVEGFDDGVVFGGYLMNMEKDPVHIYKRVSIDNWEIVYSFKKGEINHIHNIISDPYRKCLWVLTGDFDEAAAIWKVSDNYKKVEKVISNNQSYRACVAYALPEGLLYATDTPFIDNYIYLIRDLNTMMAEKVLPIDGSCIYGCKWNDLFVFSSTVEGGDENDTLLDDLLKHQLGKGIKNDYTHLYIGNLDKGFKEITKEKKDSLPYLFQFAAYMFPSGENRGDALYFYPMATKKNDLCLMSYCE